MNKQQLQRVKNMQLQENNSAHAGFVNGSEQIDIDSFDLSDAEFKEKYGEKNHGLGAGIIVDKTKKAVTKKSGLSDVALKAKGDALLAEGQVKTLLPKAPRQGAKDDHVSTQFVESVMFTRPDLSAYRLDDETMIHRWTGNHYQSLSTKDGVSEALAWLRKYRRKDATESKASEAWRSLESTLRSERSFTDYAFGNEKVIPCLDGYLHLDKQGDISFHNPDRKFGFRHLIQVRCGLEEGGRLEPKSLRPESLFAQFLNHAFPEKEVQAFVQEQCAMTFLPINYQMSAWWYGKAKTGKSTLKDLMALFHPRRSVVQMKLNEIDVPFNTQRLLGASLITTDEVKMEGKWHEESWKSIVSQAPMTIARKHKESINNYEIKAKWIVCSNQSPKISDDSEGVWRRLSIVEFKNVIEGPNVDDYHKVMFEKEGFEILQWILQGAQRLIRRGHFLPENQWPEACRRTKGAARTEANTVTHWCEEDAVSTCGTFTDKAQIYERYWKFCNAVQVDPMAPNIFWRYVRARFTDYQEKKLKIKDSSGRYVQPYVANIAWCGDVDRELEVLNESVDIPFGL
ncbi:phage/plasmid primase, P4 family [Stenotrophomonas maltophilia]|uniref:phage/plasmid primase, P4 family n=1 Tax=Stenotrophomonas maltophilia TaxID=40324 RepID=UPI0015DE4C4A